MVRTRALADNVRDVAAELRLIDLADFVTFIHREQYATIQDLVNSSIELYFKHGTLTYGAMAAFDLEWDAPPAVTLGLEFKYKAVHVAFDLMLQPHEAGIQIRCISFDDELHGEEQKTDALISAIAAAKLSKGSKDNRC